MNQNFPCYTLSSMPPREIDLGKGSRIVEPVDGREPVLLVSIAAMWYIQASEADAEGGRTLTLRGLADHRLVGQFRINGRGEIRFSPDGRAITRLASRYDPAAARSTFEIQRIDPETGKVRATIPSPGQTWGNYGWKDTPDGKSLAVYYRTGSNSYREGEPDPSERPMNVEVWEVEPR